MIVVEGLDNTGKTTLVELIQQEFPSLKMRPSIGNKHNLEQIHNAAYDEAYQPEMDRVLADRSRIISEYVYNPVIGARPIAYDFNHWMRYLGVWAQRRQLVIYCHREPMKVLEGLEDREQLEGVRDNVLILDARYKGMMHTLDFLFSLAPQPTNMIVDYDFDDYENSDYILEAVKLYCKGVM